MYCQWCKSQRIRFACGGCKQRVYCSAKCGQTDWKTHKHACIGDVDTAKAWELARKRKNIPNLTNVMGVNRFVNALKRGDLRLTNQNVLRQMTTGELITGPCVDTNEFVESLKLLGKGSFGAAYEAYINDEPLAVIKKIRRSNNKNDTIFSDTDTERRCVEFMSLEFLLKGHCPHVLPYLGSAECVDDNTTFIITKRAQYGTLGHYLERAHLEFQMDMAELARQFIFEMTYTFACIQHKLPEFVHNDIKLNNILADMGPSQGSTTYQTPNMTFRIPNMGVRSVLWDFDYASAVSIFDNVKVTQYAYTKPELGRSPFLHQGIDLLVFVTYIARRLRKYGFEPSHPTIEPILETWPNVESLIDVDDIYAAIWEDDRVPIDPLRALLTSPLFQPYRVDNSKTPPDVVFPRGTLYGTGEEDQASLIKLYQVPMNQKITSVPLGFGTSNFESIAKHIPSAHIYMRWVEPRYQYEEVLMSQREKDELEVWLDNIAYDLKLSDDQFDVALTRFNAVIDDLNPFITEKYWKLVGCFALLFDLDLESLQNVDTENLIEIIMGYTNNAYSETDISNGMIQWNWLKYLNIVVE